MFVSHFRNERRFDMKNTVSIKGERIVAVPTPIIENIKKNEFGKELYIKNMVFYPKAYFHSSECFGKEIEDYVLVYCVDGKGWVHIDNCQCQIERNQLLIIPKNKKYAYGSDRNHPWTTYWIRFNGEKAGFFSNGKHKPITIAPGATAGGNKKQNVFEEIYSLLTSGGYEINNLLYATTLFFHLLGTLKFKSDITEHERQESQRMDIIDHAIHYMKGNLNRIVTLSDIANYVGLSESYFSTLFVKKKGISPLRYLANLRFEQACHYLNSTDMKVNQICPLVGFDDSLYFSRAFSKNVGMSPSKYRMHKSA